MIKTLGMNVKGVFMFGYCPGRRRFRRLTGTMVIAAAVLTALMLGGCRKQTYQPTTPPGPQATAASPLPTATTPPPTPMIDYWPPGYSKEEAIYLGGYSYEDWLGEMGDFDTDLDKIIFDAIENAGHRSQVEKLTTVDIDGQSYPAVTLRFPDGDFLIGFDKEGAWLIVPTEGEAWWYDVEEGADIPLYSLPDEKQAFGEKLNPGEYRAVAIDGDWRNDPEKAWLKIQLENGDFGFVRARGGDLYGLNLDDIPPMISDLLKMDGYEAMPLTSSGEISDSNFKPGEEIHKTVAGVELSGNRLIRPTGDVLFYDDMAYVRTIGGERQYVSKNDLWGSPALGGEGEQKIKKGVMYPIVAVSSDGLNYQVNARGNIVWVPKEKGSVFGIHLSEIPVSDVKYATPTPEPTATPVYVVTDPLALWLKENVEHSIIPSSADVGQIFKPGTAEHQGSDIVIPLNTEVMMPMSGTIKEYYRIGNTGHGAAIMRLDELYNGAPIYLTIYHLNPLREHPNPGDHLNAGDVIGHSWGKPVSDKNNPQSDEDPWSLGPHIEVNFTQEYPIGDYITHRGWLITKNNAFDVVSALRKR